MLSAVQMAQMSSLLETALELDAAGRRSWLEGLAPEYQNLLPALRRALLPESDGGSGSEEFPDIAAIIQPESVGSGVHPGGTVGPYRLIRPLGTGGMAEVWLAERADGAFKREVALKLPMLFSLRKDLTSRFERERDILAALVHPNIARLYDAGVSRDGLPFLAMEYVVGEPFTTYCDEHRLSIRARLELFQQVLNAVRYAHANLVIHRDIKPSNILVTEVGQAHLLDFGIAKILSEGEAKETQLTRLAGRALTPDYAAPEQITGAPITTAADVYALGVVLYELLTGERPYRLKRESLGALEEAILQTEPVPPSRVAPNETSAEARATTTRKLPKTLAGGLDAITMKALKKSPGQRYGTASEFAEDIARFLRGDVVLAQPDSAVYRAVRFVRRHWVGAGAVTALVLTLAGGLAATSYEATVAAAQRDAALQAQRRSLTQTAAARLNNADVAAASGIILEVLSNRSGTRHYTADAVSVFQEARAADTQVLAATGHAGVVMFVAFSPDGQRIVTASADNTARIWDVGTGQQLRVLSGHTGPVRSVAFSPNGRRIVTASYDKTARVWDVSNGQQLLVLMGHTAYVEGVAFSPDGQRIVSASADNTARIWDVDSGQQLLVLRGHMRMVLSVAFSPDGRRIVTASEDKTARIWDSASGKPLLMLGGHTSYVPSAAFSPDGRRIVTASWDKTARIWDAASGQQILVLNGHTDAVHRAAFSPDGRCIVTASLDKTARVWDADSGQQLLVLSGHTKAVHSAAFSPDGRRVVTSSEDNTARIWDAASRQQKLVLSGHAERVESVGFSPDGQRIITASSDDTARIWDVNSGKLLLVLSGPAWMHGAAFSPGGRRVVTASRDNTARVWDVDSGQQLLVLSGHKSEVRSASFSPVGRRIVTASEDQTARVWDADSGQQLLALSGGGITSAAFSPDGRRIVTSCDDKTARVWDADSGQQLLMLTGHTDSVQSAAFSPDGRRIVTASRDKTALVWDAATGQALLMISGHTGAVSTAAFSPDGERIVTTSEDKTARIWEAASGQQLLVLSGHTAWVLSAVFSPDGRGIATASQDNTARIWDAHVAAFDAQVAWEQAAQFDPLSSTERFQLGLPPESDVHRWPTERSKCDQSAGAPYDPLRRAPGVTLDQIDADIAVPACAESRVGSNEMARSIYQHGRALMAKGNFSAAKRDLERAVAADYSAARIDLGMLLSRPSSGMLDVPRTIWLYEKAWKEGVTIAAFELGVLYEHGVSGPGNNGNYLLAPNETRALSWYQKGVEAGDPNALARFAEKEERAVLTAENSTGRTGHLLKAFRYYASAAERARLEDWPDAAWRDWRYRRASIARVLAGEGMMEQVADESTAVRKQYASRPTTWQRLRAAIGRD
jgi:WD40 repeat protein/serine/threonine protein kinase